MEQGLRALRAVRAEAGLPPAFRVAVAVSGGRDSICLLNALAALDVPLAVLHVHHGLSPAADDWLALSVAQAGLLGLPHRCRRVDIPANEQARRGMEEAARLARHAALREMALEVGADVIALAHHRDDQAETVLLQALRGAGLPGLSAMPVLARDHPPWTWRPLLDVPRKAIDEHVLRHGLRHAEDPSNTNTRHARNALRHAVLPVIERHFPGWRDTLARVAMHAADAQGRLDAQTLDDLRALRVPGAPGAESASPVDPAVRSCPRTTGPDRPGRPGRMDDAIPFAVPAAICDAGSADRPVEAGGPPALDLRRLRMLTPSRARAALRAWVADAGLRAPPAARLDDWWRQITTARPGAALSLRHEGRVLRSHQGRLWLCAPMVPAPGDPAGRGPAPAGTERAGTERAGTERAGATVGSVEADGTPDAAGTPGTRVVSTISVGKGGVGAPRVSTDGVQLRWHGESALPVPALGGTLRVEPETRPARPGLPAALLRGAPLLLRPRRGGERLRPRPGGPGRTLKNLYQSLGVPAWARASLPLLEIDGRLAWAAGIGPDASFVAHEGERLRLRWERDDGPAAG